MQRIALSLLLLMAVVFAVSFTLQDRYPWFTFVRAAAEGGMVGGLADWFAVTALFRRPLGLPIPHTNLVATKKDELGSSLGEFIETEFLSDDVVQDKLRSLNITERFGAWIAEPRGAAAVDEVVARAATAGMKLISDREVQALVDTLLERHLVEADWPSRLGSFGERLVDDGAHHSAIDLCSELVADWLERHPDAFRSVVERRAPSWLPKLAERFLDQKLHDEALRFATDLRTDPEHPFRTVIGEALVTWCARLQHDPAFRDRAQQFGHELFESQRTRALVDQVWIRTRELLLSQLADGDSALRSRLRALLRDLGRSLRADPTLQHTLNAWVISLAETLLTRYRHDFARVVSDTVAAWDPHEAAQKIELQVGKDLQFIRMNGTIVGALAGLTITAIAHGLHALA